MSLKPIQFAQPDNVAQRLTRVPIDLSSTNFIQYNIIINNAWKEQHRYSMQRVNAAQNAAN
ncbi:MAG: hypothetical protein ACJAYB_000847 [Psychromonas sp.]|jgi:hypothetical protein